MKKVVILLALILVVFVFSLSVMGDNLGDSTQNIEKEEIVLNDNSCVITDRLFNYIEKTKSGIIAVNIQIKDDIDLEKIEEQAFKMCNITKEELEKMEEYSFKLSDDENIEYQKQILGIYDNIFIQKKELLKKYFKQLNTDFVVKQGWNESEYEEICELIPFVEGVNLTKEEIYELSELDEVRMIDLCDYSIENTNSVTTSACSSDIESYPSVDETVSIIRGNIATNAGYTGSGIKVGVIEGTTPDLNVLGEDAKNINIIYENSPEDYNYHSTIVCGIIKKMAPDCSIYAYASKEDNSINALKCLVDDYNVRVVNMSFGTSSASGNYNYYSAQLDYYVNYYDITIIVAAGNMNVNAENYYDDKSEYVSNFAMSPNVIAVGNVKSSGTDQTTQSAYTRIMTSSYIESSAAINRPDISAPGYINMYSYGNRLGTSFSAPHVTGTVIQMISRNSGLIDKPTILKASVLASATYGTALREYMRGLPIDDYEGAGVIDAGFCYDVAKNGRRTHFDTSVTTSSYSYNVYCDYTDRPFRIACAWNTYAYTNSEGKYSQLCDDYNIVVYKNGIPIASSSGSSNQDLENVPNTNYEIVELEETKVAYWGAGYYTVTIERIGNTMTSGSFRIGLAWEQP